MLWYSVAGNTCGAGVLLARKRGRVVAKCQKANAAEHPDDFSVIHPDDQLRINKDIEKYDGEEYAYYHSHPRTEAYPSSRDIEYAKYNKLYYIIFSHQYYPDPPYASEFLIYDDDTVVEGKIEIILSRSE